MPIAENDVCPAVNSRRSLQPISISADRAESHAKMTRESYPTRVRGGLPGYVGISTKSGCLEGMKC